MIPRPPRSTRTDTLFPYTTLFRSNGVIDENYWLAAYIGGALGRDAGWTVNAYANWLSSTDPFVCEVAGYGATAAYYRLLTKRLRATAAIGIDGATRDEPSIDDIWTASALVGQIGRANV